MNAIGLSFSIALAAAAAALPVAVSAEISGPCSQAVGTFLTRNALDNGGRSGTSRSILVLTNGGHALRFDSDEDGAAVDYRAFGDSAGTWRCDGVDEDGTVHLTATTLDFTFPDTDGEKGQIARIDMTGTYAPKTDSLELKGKLGFLPMDAEAQGPGALSEAASTIDVTFRATRIEPPNARRGEP